MCQYKTVCSALLRPCSYTVQFVSFSLRQLTGLSRQHLHSYTKSKLKMCLLRCCLLLLPDASLQDLTPPKDSNVRVMVMRDHGSIALSHSACVPLVKGSVHNLKCSEAEHLVRMGVLQVLDANC